VVVERHNPDETWQFLRISIAGGSPQLLVSLGWRRPMSMGFRRVDLSPDGRYLAYSALAVNPTQANPPLAERADERIYVLSTDGARQAELTKMSGNNLNPMWSANGSHVLFLSDRTGIFDLWAVEVEEGKAKGAPVVVKRDIGRITPLGVSNLGTYRYHTGAKTIAQVSLRRTATPDAIEELTEPLLGGAPRWSPDGKSIAVLKPLPRPSEDTDLIVRIVATGEEQRFPLPGVTGFSRPMWYADSGAVLVSVFQAQSRQRLYRADLKTGQLTEVTAVGQFVAAGNGLLGTISPDGRTLYVRGRLASKWDDVKVDRIVAVDLTTGNQRDVATTRGANELVGPVALSPDGQTLAFVIWDDEARPKAVARVGVDGSGYGAISTTLGSEPPLPGHLWWSGDGKAILIALLEADGKQHITRIDSESGSLNPTGIQLPSKVSADLRRDGSRLAVSTTSTEYELWQLTNLPPTLLRRR
jgi:Tol biopolymer transport system component